MSEVHNFAECIIPIHTDENVVP